MDQELVELIHAGTEFYLKCRFGVEENGITPSDS